VRKNGVNPEGNPEASALRPAADPSSGMPAADLHPRERTLIIGAALLALFLGALDALVMSAAMPTIVADLGGLHLYSWVYSAYFLARAVSLPIFGKLADLYNTKRLFLFSIGLFLLASVAAGAAPDMKVLVAARIFQGIGAGGNFALVYIVLADIASPANRGRTQSLASSIWGIASVLGPTLGGFIVTYFSWRWIFFINVPLGVLSLAGIGACLRELRAKRRRVDLDFAGVATLTTTILALLSAFLLGGRTYPWGSAPIVGLLLLTAAAGVGFYFVEKRAKDPILSIRFFAERGFSVGNGAVFLSSFAIFSLFAYAPLFIQGALGKSPMEVGVAMLSLSLGWSVGSLLLGQIVHRLGHKAAAILGAVLLAAGCGLTLGFDAGTGMTACFWVFLLVGLGMGFVTLATLLVVQASVSLEDLGVATASNQFARTLGGTVGVGVCGSFVAAKMAAASATWTEGGPGRLPAAVLARIGDHSESLLRPEIQALLPPEMQERLVQAVVDGVGWVFVTVLAAALLCLGLCLMLPGRQPA
jgi:EmrB/QacA subfamily drug resistance transporter